MINSYCCRVGRPYNLSLNCSNLNLCREMKETNNDLHSASISIFNYQKFIPHWLNFWFKLNFFSASIFWETAKSQYTQNTAISQAYILPQFFFHLQALSYMQKHNSHKFVSNCHIYSLYSAKVNNYKGSYCAQSSNLRSFN